MKAVKNIGWLFCVSSLIVACGSTVKYYKTNNLRNYPKIHLMLASTSGAISVSSVSMGSAYGAGSLTGNSVSAGGVAAGLSSTHAINTHDHAILAAKDLEFRLREIGFNFAGDGEEADVDALFSIGTIRHDPLAGMIADQAFLEFKDRKTGDVVAVFKADVQFITPTISTIIKSLVKSVKSAW